MFRCCDVSAAQRMKRRFSHIVAIIPGPVEPKNLEPYLQNTLDVLQKHGPEGECGVHVGSYSCMHLQLLIQLYATVES
jgi:hypothetical protein